MRPKAIFLNASRLNFDKKLDLKKLESVTELKLINVDALHSAEDIISHVRSSRAEIVITKEMEIPSEAIEGFPSCVKLLCEAGTGYNNIPIELARLRGMDVVNIPTYSTASVAHMVITYIMSFSAALFAQAKKLNDGDRSNFRVFSHPIYEITGKRLGLIGGSGTIGTAVMDVALPLGMDIAVTSRADCLPKGHKYENDPRVSVVTLENLLSTSDFVSINVPLNAQTRHSIGRKEIELMKSTAFLINTARGAIINEAELIQCMKEGMIAGAGLDTQEMEPPAQESDIWCLENVFMTPHIGWRRMETRQRLLDKTVENIQAYVSGKPINVVN